MRRHLLILAAVGLGLGLWGIRWALPSQDRLSRVLPPQLQTPEFHERLVATWKAMYADLGEEPILNPKLWAQPFTGAVSVAAGWQFPPQILINSVRSFHLRTGQDDEAPILVALSRVKPWKLELNPRIYTYGGLFFYLLGPWIALCMLLTGHTLSSNLSFYIAHPDQMAWMYLSGRFFSLFHYLLGIFGVYLVGKKLWDAKSGFWAALFFAVSPGIVLQAHLIKPHLLGAFFVMMVFYCCARALQRQDRRSWVLAGAMAGAAAACAPYMGLCAGVVAVALCLHVWEKGHQVLAADAKHALAAAGAAAAVFLITNPFFIYQFGTSWEALRLVGRAAGREWNHIWQFPLFGYRLAVTAPIAVLVFWGALDKNNLRDPVRRLALAVFLFYFLNAWMLQTAQDMIGARNFPAFFIGFLLAGRRIAKSGRAVRGLAAAAAAYACLMSGVLDYNLHLDAANRSTRHAAGSWIEENIKPGSELGFFRLPQPSGGAYFRWDRYKMTFIQRAVFNESPPERLPAYLVLTCPAYDERPQAGPNLEKYYTHLKTFEQFALPGVRLPVGDIFGNPLIAIYARSDLNFSRRSGVPTSSTRSVVR